MSEKLGQKMGKSVGDLKNQASKLSKDAVKTVDTLKQAVQSGVEVSKGILEKAGKAVNKKNLGGGIETASRGIDMVAKGARFASKGAETLASSMEKASDKIRKASAKLKD